MLELIFSLTKGMFWLLPVGRLDADWSAFWPAVKQDKVVQPGQTCMMRPHRRLPLLRTYSNIKSITVNSVLFLKEISKLFPQGCQFEIH